METCIRVGALGKKLAVKVQGRAAFRQSQLLEDFILSQPGKGCVIDFLDCEYVDSTFMGMVFGLYERLSESSLKLEIVNLSGRVERSFGEVGLSHLLKVGKERIEAEEWKALEGGKVKRERIADHILRAHERLEKISPQEYNLVEKMLVEETGKKGRRSPKDKG